MKGVRAIVVAHPAKITLDDIAGVATPFAVLIGDHDEVTSLAMVEEWRPILEAKPEVRCTQRVALPTPADHHLSSVACLISLLSHPCEGT